MRNLDNFSLYYKILLLPPHPLLILQIPDLPRLLQKSLDRPLKEVSSYYSLL